MVQESSQQGSVARTWFEASVEQGMEALQALPMSSRDSWLGICNGDMGAEASSGCMSNSAAKVAGSGDV